MQTQVQIESGAVTQPTRRSKVSTAEERLRVLHVIAFMGRGGAEMGILKLIEGLGPEFEHRICATRGFDEEFVRTKLSTVEVSTAGSPEVRLQFPLFRLERIMRSYKPHIVHTRNWGAIEAVLAAKLARVPVIIHSEHGYELDMFSGLPFRRRMFRRAAYGIADHVFALTRELRDFHARQAWVDPDRIGVIYNGVDTQRFAPDWTSRVSMRRELGFPDTSFVIGSVGRMVPIKDYATLLKSAGTLAENGRDVRVLLVGAGPELDKLRAQAAGPLAGRVCFAGDSDRVPELLNAMDVFVLSSLKEGMSNTLLEAMACGLPTLATNVGGNPEIIEDKVSGCLFAPGDTEWLAAKLKALAEDQNLGRSLGSAARRRATAAFSLDRMMKNYRNLYVDLASRRQVAAAGMDTAHVRN